MFIFIFIFIKKKNKFIPDFDEFRTSKWKTRNHGQISAGKEQ